MITLEQIQIRLAEAINNSGKTQIAKELNIRQSNI